MKRLVVLLTAAVLCLTSCTCVNIPLPNRSSKTDSTTTAVATTTTQPLPFEPKEEPLDLLLTNSGYLYECLSAKQRENYAYIVRVLNECSGEESTVEDGAYGIKIRLPHGGLTEMEMEQLFEAVYDDHPEFFYLESRFVMYTVGEVNYMDFYYTMSASERREAATVLKTTVTELVTSCQSDSEFETELRLHDALVSMCNYNDAAAESEATDPYRYLNNSPYSALCKGEAICGGYTRAMQLLLTQCGIQSTPVYNEDHVWNLVWIDGEPYHLDATWNDGDPQVLQHAYFNITDEELTATRETQEPLFPLPAATATDANYFVAMGYWFDAVPSDALTDSIVSQLLENAEQFEVRLTPEAYDDMMGYIESGEIFDEFEPLTMYEGGYAIQAEWDSFQYYATDELCTVTFFAEDA